MRIAIIDVLTGAIVAAMGIFFINIGVAVWNIFMIVLGLEGTFQPYTNNALTALVIAWVLVFIVVFIMEAPRKPRQTSFMNPAE